MKYFPWNVFRQKYLNYRWNLSKDYYLSEIFELTADNLFEGKYQLSTDFYPQILFCQKFKKIWWILLTKYASRNLKFYPNKRNSTLAFCHSHLYLVVTPLSHTVNHPRRHHRLAAAAPSCDSRLYLVMVCNIFLDSNFVFLFYPLADCVFCADEKSGSAYKEKKPQALPARRTKTTVSKVNQSALFVFYLSLGRRNAKLSLGIFFFHLLSMLYVL